MGSSTTYRLWMHIDDVAAAREALKPMSELLTGPARRADFDWWNGMPAMFDARTSFSDLIPPTQPEGPDFWAIEGEVLVLCVDLINPSVRHDDGPVAEIGEPSRATILMRCLEGLSSEPDGRIVGGVQYDHADDWLPLVSWKGRILPAYVPGASNYDKRPDGIVQHPGIIPVETIRESADGRSLGTSSR